MDKRLIQTIRPYEFRALDQLVPILFNLRSKPAKDELGLLADEINKVEPLLVKKHPSGFIEVDYEKLSILLLSIIKQMDNGVARLEERISVLENNQKLKKPTKNV